jgi:HEAT repeat protein
MTHFCPNCWKTVDADADKCDACGFQLADYDSASYERKLLAALRHPVRENRLLAVQVLGRIPSRRAVPEFRRLLEAESDYYLLKEVLLALATIGTPQAIALLQEARRHSSRLVQKLARDLAAKREGRPHRPRKRA